MPDKYNTGPDHAIKLAVSELLLYARLLLIYRMPGAKQQLSKRQICPIAQRTKASNRAVPRELDSE